ncbi:DUF998 domain-containing protein [uncultured Demequina sp.]|uniref:DUF998 domain-containing protein n=1 Tax=uncultured Demequina sp. TaxID=693499 RepID=UPI0025CBDE3B|nr:DUF998 domain-containing protein [uncultured Demequina sp.]
MSRADARAGQRTTGRVPLSSGALGLAAVFAAGFWVGVVVAFHWIRSDLEPCCAFVSNYARGDLDWLMQAAFVVFGFGWMAVGIALHRALRGLRGAHLVLATLLVAGVGFVGSGVFRADDVGRVGAPSTENMMHTLAGILAFGGLIVFGIAAWFALRREPTLRPLALPHLALGLVTLVLLVTFTVWAETTGDGFGWWQRLLVMVVLPGWQAWLGMRLVKATAPPASS